MTKAVGKDGFLFFKKTFFAERPVQLRSAKLGTPELGKVFPELPRVVARGSRQRSLCRRPLSAKRPHFVLFFSFHIDKHTHKYIYIYIYIYHMQHSHNTYISHPQVHTSPQVSTSPQVHRCLKSIETSSQHDQLSPRAYGDCSCSGKGGTGSWRTCSPLGDW
jgi:hypothetical protein